MYFSLPLVSACLFLIFVEVRTKTTELTSVQIVKAAKERCMKETNVTPDQTKVILNHAEIPKDDGERCFMECMYKGVGMIKDGKYSVEGAHKLIELKYKGDEATIGKKITSECAQKLAQKEGETCYLGRAIRECVVEISKDFDFFPGA